MMWLVMIMLHAVAGAAAFAVGIAALQPDRVRRHRWLPSLLTWLIAGMVLFLVGAMVSHWADLSGSAKTAFSGLALLGLYMLHRARRAGTAARLTGPHNTSYMDGVGFILIALFNGFVIVTALDLGAPPVAVVLLAALAVVVGHHVVAHAKNNAGLADDTPV